MKQGLRRFIGIDLAKKSYVAHIVSPGSDKGRAVSGKTTSAGLQKLYTLLDQSDLVSIECTAQATWLTRQIIEKVGCKVYLLNAGDLAIIYRSTKKTDLNDAQKLAWILQRLPARELPIVPLPSQQEEERRMMTSELHARKKYRTQAINRIHSIFTREGITDLKRSNLATSASREESLKLLEGRSALEARRWCRELSIIEINIQEIEAEIDLSLVDDKKAERLLSISGVGSGTAISVLAYMGDGSRFSNPHQFSNYVGMTPRVYSSGETTRMGHITRRGCRAIRSIIVQAAWSAVHARNPNSFKTKYQQLVPRIGKKKAIVAIARRMLETMWILVTRDEYFRDWDESSLRLKLQVIRRNAQKALVAC